MSERWWRRRKRYDSSFGNFSDDADRMEKIMDNMIRQAFRSPAEREKARRHHLQQFGDLPSTRFDSANTKEEYEPLVDVFSDETGINIVAELPGVEKDSIEVNCTQDKVTISVGSTKRKYYKELNLSAKVDPKSSSASYKNGVLEVRLKKLIGERLLVK